MKKAIVTGSTGFIGSVFVEYLTNKGIEVLALGRRNLKDLSKRRRTKILKATYLQIDMEKINNLNESIKSIGWDPGTECIFFNLAWGGEDRLSDLKIKAQMNNISWSVSALYSAVDIGCKSFIQVGTMEEAFTDKYLDLDYKKDSQYNRHVIYSVAKISAKYALQVLSSQLKIDFIYVLHSHVMGPDDDKDSFLQVTLNKLIKGEELIFSSGEQYFDVISAKDCAIGYYLICEKGKSGSEYWVGSGYPQRLRSYIERMYSLFPSGKALNFGQLPYNDIILKPEDFSILNLTRDTGYLPSMSYEDTVIELYLYLKKSV
tara:strand:+ start:264 stop:1214 length:951 start_codon:yes stop_codon:yes gene_type:complete